MSATNDGNDSPLHAVTPPGTTDAVARDHPQGTTEIGPECTQKSATRRFGAEIGHKADAEIGHKAVAQNRPHIIPVGAVAVLVCGCVGADGDVGCIGDAGSVHCRALPFHHVSLFHFSAELHRLLTKHRQTAWLTRQRFDSLLVLLDYLHRNDSANGVTISDRLARSYCSQLCRGKSAEAADSEKSALLLLIRIGVLARIQPAVNGWHVKAAARYRLTPGFRAGMKREVVPLSARSARKLGTASQRLAKGLGKRFSVLPGVIRSLDGLSFPQSTRLRIEHLRAEVNHKTGKCDLAASIGNAVKAVDSRKHTARVDSSGTVRTSFTNCPKRLKYFVHLHGVPTIPCDVQACHSQFLPRILSNRRDWLASEGRDAETLAAYDAEIARLISVVSAGDFYAGFCKDPDDADERKEKKDLINMLLNSPAAKCEGNALWGFMACKFPLLFAALASLKKSDHRNFSKQARNYTAAAINGALLDCQERGIAAIPDTDCLLVQQGRAAEVSRIIGARMFTETRGVCASVGGIRYAPENQSAVLQATALPRSKPAIVTRDPAQKPAH